MKYESEKDETDYQELLGAIDRLVKVHKKEPGYLLFDMFRYSHILGTGPAVEHDIIEQAARRIGYKGILDWYDSWAWEKVIKPDLILSGDTDQSSLEFWRTALRAKYA